MDYLQTTLSIIGVVSYIPLVLGVFYVLRHKSKLGYGLLLAAFGYEIIVTIARGSVFAGVNAIFGAVIFTSVLAWFAYFYELKKVS